MDLLLDLGDLPLANGFRREVDLEAPVAPCRVMVCVGCRHVQLGDTVHPDALFRTYPFRSGASGGWRAHVDAFAAQQGRGGGRLAVDIGSNDGTMLRALSAREYRVLGVDPSEENNLEHGMPFLTGYWTAITAKQVVERYGRASLMTAWNVLGHVDRTVEFLDAAALALAPDGRLVVETPWIVPLVERGAYDTFYHEHIHTWGLGPLVRVAKEVGLLATSCGVVPVHGGSLRVTFQRQGVQHISVQATIAREQMALRPLLLEAFGWKVKDAQRQIGEWCADHRRADNLVVGYGASARGMVLLNTIPDLAQALQSIVDDTPEKQGLVTPGFPVPIERPSQWLRGADAMVAMSYPWAGRMLEQARAWGFRGPMYVPFHGELT